MYDMKRLIILVLLIAASPMFGQVQERFKKTDRDTTKQEPTENKENASSSKPMPSSSKTSNTDFWDNVMIGGGVSASFGGYTSLYLAPSLGYRLDEHWVVGTGYNYMYFKANQAYNYTTQQYTRIKDGYESTIHGPKVFVNFFPFNGLYTGVQYEYLNHDIPEFYTNQPGYELKNVWTPVLFLEIGIGQQIGANGVVQLGLRYNVLHDYDSPYSGAFFPVIGFMF